MPGAGVSTDPSRTTTAAAGDSPAIEWRETVAIALVSAAVLLVEIAITRILSVVVWYHFAFLAVSLALLGLGAPGVWFQLRPPSPRALPASLLAAGVAIPASVVAIFKLGRPLKEAGRLFPGLASASNGGVLMLVVAVLVPMLCLGAAVCLLLLRAPGRRIGVRYAADLLGATVGAALVVPLLLWAPTPLVVAGAGFLPLAAAAIVAPRARIAALGLAVLLGGAMAWQEPFRLRYSKEYAESPDLLYEKWTPTARITIYPKPFFTPDPSKAFGWGFGVNYGPSDIEQLWVEQDGGAGTPITRYPGSVSDPRLEFLMFDVTSLGYALWHPGRVCIIGAGGGRDILTALRNGAREVTAVELNPTIVDAVSGTFRELSGDPYHLPGVRAVTAEGRNFLTHAPGPYDLIQISLIDSWAATAAGAFALSENYLYTTQAMRLYWRRLAPHGVVSISRYSTLERATEVLRLTLLARQALLEAGIAEPRRHIVVVTAGGVATLLMMRDEIDGRFFEAMEAVCEGRGFDRMWPLLKEEPTMNSVARIMRADSIDMGSRFVDLSPPTDDRPFFFQTAPVFGHVSHDKLSKLSANESSVLLLRSLAAIVCVLAALLFLAPFAVARRLPRGPGFWRGSAYFAAIGLGFMFVEAPWLQRFILLLGHPSYATTVVLAALLLAAGAGALVASRLAIERARLGVQVLPIVLMSAQLILAPVIPAALGWGFASRVALTLIVIAPAGFLMGFAFPTGMSSFGEANRAWFWAVNGVASVVATVLALMLSMAWGLSSTVTLGAAVYAVAALLLRGAGRAPAAARAPRSARGARTRPGRAATART